MNNSKIYGEASVIKRVSEASPSDKGVCVNMDAIRQLPDEFEAVITEVKFNPNDLKESFSDVGNGTWMPTPAMHYKIAEAKGISGGEKSLIEPIYEDVDMSEMTRDPAPTFQKMKTGYRCSKYSTVIEEDGTLRRSSKCTIDYNVWNRCVELWAKEEQYSEGYTIPLSFNGKQYPPRYDTKFKRKAHFASEMKFAMQKAETKAHEKTIRELAGLMTGYKKEDLKSGSLVFAKIRRSRETLQLETAARLHALSNGQSAEKPAAGLLFGETSQEPETVVQDDRPLFVGSPRDAMIAAFEKYKEDGFASGDEINKRIGWLKSTQDPQANSIAWDSLILMLKAIEEELPEFAEKFPHGLY